MKSLFLIVALIYGQIAFASEPPADYPIVKGILRKIDLAAGRVTLKHEDIPNLNMPGMTMGFLVKDPDSLKSLAVGDKVLFVADEVEEEMTILWIEKAPPVELNTANILCTGIAETTPRTNVEIEIRPGTYSTIRYEYAEGPYKGTSHINSLGELTIHKRGDFYIYKSGQGKMRTQLLFKKDGDQILDPCFTNYSAGMDRSPVQCLFD